MNLFFWYLPGCVVAFFVHLFAVKKSGSKRVKLVPLLLSIAASWLTLVGVIGYMLWDIHFINPLGYEGPSEATRIDLLRRRKERVTLLITKLREDIAPLGSIDLEIQERAIKNLRELECIVIDTPDLINDGFNG